MRTPVRIAKAFESLEWQTTEATAEAVNLSSALVGLIRDTMVEWRPEMGSTLTGVEFDYEDISFSAN